jgi:hypothetical protein
MAYILNRRRRRLADIESQQQHILGLELESTLPSSQSKDNLLEYPLKRIGSAAELLKSAHAPKEKDWIAPRGELKSLGAPGINVHPTARRRSHL